MDWLPLSTFFAHCMYSEYHKNTFDTQKYATAKSLLAVNITTLSPLFCLLDRFLPKRENALLWWIMCIYSHTHTHTHTNLCIHSNNYLCTLEACFVTAPWGMLQRSYSPILYGVLPQVACATFIVVVFSFFFCGLSFN